MNDYIWINLWADDQSSSLPILSFSLSYPPFFFTINLSFNLHSPLSPWPSHPLQLSQRAREIYNSFLSSKATTPVNIDSQAQLADDILNAPRPDMFKEQQLQVSNHNKRTH